MIDLMKNIVLTAGQIDKRTQSKIAQRYSRSDEHAIHRVKGKPNSPPGLDKKFSDYDDFVELVLAEGEQAKANSVLLAETLAYELSVKLNPSPVLLAATLAFEEGLDDSPSSEVIVLARQRKAANLNPSPEVLILAVQRIDFNLEQPTEEGK